MIIPPLGGAGGVGGLGGLQTPGSAEGLEQGVSLGQSEGLLAPDQTSGGVGASDSSGFGSALTDAISSLEKTQQSGDSAAQSLAAGTVKDPESAVVTVEDAQLAMQLAAQIRTKATEAVQTIFQTQV